MSGLEQELNDAGYRLTRPRRAVLSALRESSEPLTPQELFERARVDYPALGLVTVYRLLDVLADNDLVRRIHRGDGCHASMISEPGHRHAVVCTECGRAVEFQGCDDLQALIHRVETETAFTVDEHLLQLSGRCESCAEKAGERS